MSASASKTSLHGHVAGARRAAVVLAGVDLQQPVADEPDGVAERLLVDVHVERVEQHADVVRADAVEQLEHLLGGVDEVGLEAVERLDREPDAALGGVVGDRLDALDRERALLLALGRLEHPRLADGRVHRADDVRGADRRPPGRRTA